MKKSFKEQVMEVLEKMSEQELYSMLCDVAEGGEGIRVAILDELENLREEY